MSARWHEVRAHGGHRIVAYRRDGDPGPAPHYAVTTADGAVLRRDLTLPEAQAWLEHLDRSDPRPSARTHRRAR